MGRRIANQVHKQAARLLRGNYLQKEPLWYQAVLEHPPIPLPPRAPPRRSAYDLPRDKSYISPKDNRPSPIVYLEDRIRKQFFRDHPFEAFRPRVLVEKGELEDEHPISGENWNRLSQRGRNPSPEDAIRFTLNLHRFHNMALSKAYKTAVVQYRTLKSEHEVATITAVAEAEEYGCKFGLLETEKIFEKEEQVLRTLETPVSTTENLPKAHKRWKAILDRPEGLQERDTWTRGQEYVRLWKQGIRPDYAPRSITTPPEDSYAELDHFSLRERMSEQMQSVSLKR